MSEDLPNIFNAAERIMNEHITWKTQYVTEMRRMAGLKIPFIADDITAVVKLPKNMDGRAIGALFSKARKEGWLKKTGEFIPVASSNNRPVTQWVGV